jgi:hypothetical protein
MENNAVNIGMLAEVARGLKELRPKMVFVGGAVISLYMDDPAAEESRPTTDIDLTIQLTGFSEWTKVQKRLAELGFYPDSQGRAICSYLYKSISVDIIPSEDSFLGPSNSWYKPGFQFLNEVIVDDEIIRILSPPYYLATKFEAFHTRGVDYRTSHDFEDIIQVVDNKMGIVEDILNSDDKVKLFLQEEFREIVNSRYAEEIIKTQIHPLIVNERFPIVLEKLNKILG